MANKLTQMNKWRSQLADAGVKVDVSWSYEQLKRRAKKLGSSSKRSSSKRSSSKRSSSKRSSSKRSRGSRKVNARTKLQRQYKRLTGEPSKASWDTCTLEREIKALGERPAASSDKVQTRAGTARSSRNRFLQSI